MVTTVQNWGDAVLVSVTTALQNFLGFLPALIGAVIVLVVGWIIAGLLARLVESVLKRVGFERAAQTTGISGFIERSGSGWSASKVIAEIVKWFIRLVAIQAAASILGMAQITAIINSILLWLPNLIVALAIVVLGALIARFVAGLVRGTASEMGFSDPELLANIARYAILTFAAIAAIDQLGIAATVVNTMFIAVVAAAAAAFALAFGLGGREVAAEITRTWYQRGQAAGEKVSQRMAQARTETPSEPARDEPARPAPAPVEQAPEG